MYFQSLVAPGGERAVAFAPASDIPARPSSSQPSTQIGRPQARPKALVREKVR